MSVSAFLSSVAMVRKRASIKDDPVGVERDEENWNERGNGVISLWDVPLRPQKVRQTTLN